MTKRNQATREWDLIIINGKMRQVCFRWNVSECLSRVAPKSQKNPSTGFTRIYPKVNWVCLREAALLVKRHQVETHHRTEGGCIKMMILAHSGSLTLKWWTALLDLSAWMKRCSGTWVGLVQRLYAPSMRIQRKNSCMWTHICSLLIWCLQVKAQGIFFVQKLRDGFNSSKRIQCALPVLSSWPSRNSDAGSKARLCRCKKKTLSECPRRIPRRMDALSTLESTWHPALPQNAMTRGGWRSLRRNSQQHVSHWQIVDTRMLGSIKPQLSILSFPAQAGKRRSFFEFICPSGTRRARLELGGGRVRPSVDNHDLVWTVAVPEWDAGGLAPVMQTFAGPLGVFDHLPHRCTASNRDNVSRFGTLASSR